MKLAETPGERLQRAVYAAAALAGVRATEPEVAKAVGLTRKVIHGLFTGTEPRGDVLRKIADGLETTTPEALLAAREGRPPEAGLERIANEINELRQALIDQRTRRVIEQARSEVAEAEADLARRRAEDTTPPRSTDPDGTEAEPQGSPGGGGR